jgi:pilus assembly protein Flp/PilA
MRAGKRQRRRAGRFRGKWADSAAGRQPGDKSRSMELDMKAKLAQFWNDEDGITALEYGLIAGMIAVALLISVKTFTDALDGLFAGIGEALSGNTPGGG